MSSSGGLSQPQDRAATTAAIAGSSPVTVKRTYHALVLDRLGGREKVIGILTASVVIGICVWIVSQVALYLFIYSQSLPSLGSEGWVKWAQILSQVSYAVWLGALALLLLLWLRERLAGPTVPPSEHD